MNNHVPSDEWWCVKKWLKPHQYPTSGPKTKTTNPREDLLEFLNNRFDRDYVEPNVACFYFSGKNGNSLSTCQVQCSGQRVGKRIAGEIRQKYMKYGEMVCNVMKSQNFMMKHLKSYETHDMNSKLGEEFINQSFQNIAPATFVVEMFLFLWFGDLAPWLLPQRGKLPKGPSILPWSFWASSKATRHRSWKHVPSKSSNHSIS